MVMEVETCSLSGAGGMLGLWPYNIADVDVGHYLAKQQKVELFPGECATLIPDIFVVLLTEIPVTVSPTATPLYQESSKLVIGFSLPR